MSCGQKPRRPAFFPRMKVRNPRRLRRLLMVTWDEQWQPTGWAIGRHPAGKIVHFAAEGSGADAVYSMRIEVAS